MPTALPPSFVPAGASLALQPMPTALPPSFAPAGDSLAPQSKRGNAEGSPPTSLTMTFEADGKEAFTAINHMNTIQGYPWFMRQFANRAFSTLAVESSEETVTLHARGTFFGFSLSLVEKRLPPMVISRPSPVSSPKYKLIPREIGNSGLAKLGYRFVNTHKDPVHAYHSPGSGAGTVTNSFKPQDFMNGSTTIQQELLVFDPIHFFGKQAVSIYSIFDADEMGRWVDGLSDVDASGLPKEMVRQQWNRRLTRLAVKQLDGQTFLNVHLEVYEYDSDAGDWSRFRCQGSGNFKLASKREEAS
ncbi:hypothetical protein N9U05_00175 [bacterium]|jgi:hypothetical protein|nr:hypothetical protein [bacterium]